VDRVVVTVRRAVTLVDVLDGHVGLDIECLDRIYLNGYVPGLQTSGGLVRFLEGAGYPIASPAALGRIGDRFRRAVYTFAEANDIPVVRFGKHDRKIDVVRPYLQAAERAGRSRVAAIGVTREFQWVFDCTTRDDGGPVPWFDYYRTERLVSCFYFYVWDERCGPGFIKVCSYAPYPIKIWLNGHEIVRRMAAGAGIGVTPLANGFAAATDPVGLQQLCDRIQAGTLRVFFDRWAARVPLPLTGADRVDGYWWEISMRQVEVARTLVFDDPRRVRTVFEQLLTGNLDLGRPEQVEIIFGRRVTARTPGVFSTRLLNRADQVTINFGFKHSRVKIYLKQDRALRVETVVNDPADVGCRRGLDHLDQLVRTAGAINARLMEAIRVGQGCGVLASPVFERIARPTRTSDGRTRVPAMRFGDPRVQALAGALAVLGFAVTGITNKSLRAWMTGLLGQPYSMNQASYDLARLKANQLIERIGHTNTYRLTGDGRTFAIFYSKVHDRLLYPLMAADQPIAAPPEVRRALATLDRHIDTTIAAAGLQPAA